MIFVTMMLDIIPLNLAHDKMYCNYC